MTETKTPEVCDYAMPPMASFHLPKEEQEELLEGLYDGDNFTA